MRSLILILLSGFCLLFTNTGYSGEVNNDQAGQQSGLSQIQVISSPEVAELASALVSRYNQTQPVHTLAVSIRAEEVTGGNLHFFTSNDLIFGNMDLSEKIMIGHEIIVPVMNVRNPLVEEIYRRGLTGKDFSRILSVNPGWSSIKSGAGNIPLHVYVAENNGLISKLASFCEMDQSIIAAQKVSSPDELLSIVRKDIYAVGFCNLTDALNAEKTGFSEQISIVPIDKNQNGRLDGFENIYSSPDEFTHGVWIGKYPRKLCSEIYAASATSNFDEASAAFLNWVITDGQKNLPALGFNHLLTREKTAGMLALMPDFPSGSIESVPQRSNVWVIILSAAAFVFLVVAVVRASLKRKTGIRSEDIEVTPALNADSILAPAGLFYDKTHTWAFIEQNGLVKIGIDDFLQHVTGPVSQIKMKASGEKVRKGEKILTLIQEGKQLDISSPVTGYIKTQNRSLLNNPSQINIDPYLSGWVYQIEPANWLRETRFMFMADKFKEWIEDEFIRLKDFLAASANSNAVVYNHIVLQDGGELTDNVLANLEPEIWEDFQTQFIDESR